MGRKIMTVMEFLTTLYVVVTALLVIVGCLQLSPLNKSLRSRIYFDALTLLEGKNGEIRLLRHLLEEGVKIAGGDKDRFTNWIRSGEDKPKQLDQLAREYDKIGHLVKYGVVPLDFLFDFYSRSIVMAWQHINPLITQEGIVRGQQMHMFQFHILAVGAALYRNDKYSESPPFSISTQDQEEWKRWKKWCKGNNIYGFF